MEMQNFTPRAQQVLALARGGGVHNNMQPSAFLNLMVKL